MGLNQVLCSVELVKQMAAVILEHTHTQGLQVIVDNAASLGLPDQGDLVRFSVGVPFQEPDNRDRYEVVCGGTVVSIPDYSLRRRHRGAALAEDVALFLERSGFVCRGRGFDQAHYGRRDSSEQSCDTAQPRLPL